LAILGAIFTRRFSRSAGSWANKASMTASALASLRLAHGLAQDLQCSRHLQTDKGFADAIADGRSPASQSRLIPLAGQAPADSLVEVMGLRRDVPGAKDQDRLVAMRIGRTGCAAIRAPS
jgi:hypothetical protein